MKRALRASLVLALALAAAQAYAQDDKKDEKKDDKKPDAVTVPKGFPSSADLKTKCGLDDDQTAKIDAIYTDCKDRFADIQKRLDDGDKKAKKDGNKLKAEICAKIHDLGKDDDQKQKIDDALPKPKKKKNNA